MTVNIQSIHQSVSQFILLTRHTKATISSPCCVLIPKLPSLWLNEHLIPILKLLSWYYHPNCTIPVLYSQPYLLKATIPKLPSQYYLPIASTLMLLSQHYQSDATVPLLQSRCYRLNTTILMLCPAATHSAVPMQPSWCYHPNTKIISYKESISEQTNCKKACSGCW